MDSLPNQLDPATFREHGHALIDLLADYLENVRRGDGPVISNEDPDEAVRHWQRRLEEGRRQEPNAFYREVLAHTFRIHHPGNLGHQVGANLPVTALTECLMALLDTGNGVYEVGNPATPMERVVIQRLANHLGFSEKADGVLVSGGSLGNLTALLAARQVKSPGNIWRDGIADLNLTLLASEEAHYCVERAAGIMGMGTAGLLRVHVDEDFRLRSKALETAHARALDQGKTIIAVVASACSTATGTFDPLEEIATFCREHDLWLHVDAAHGGCAALSRTYRHLLRGIEHADSVVIDLHKMFAMPTLVTAVIFRDGDHSYQTFAQEAGYLWQTGQAREWYNLAKRTVECTKPMLGLRAYAAFHLVGEPLLAEHGERLFALASHFAKLLREADDFELLTEPMANIVCYRYRPKDLEESEVDQLNRQLRHALVEQGAFYVVQIQKRGRHWLRSALMSPFTEERDLRKLLDTIRALGAAELRQR